MSPGWAFKSASLILVNELDPRTKVPDLTASLAPDSTLNTRSLKLASDAASRHREHTPMMAKQ